MSAPTASQKTADAARAKIVQGARAHFLADGFRSVTMDDLAGELGMSKKTLYAHFASKTALVEAVILDKLARLETDLEGVTSAKGSPFPELLARLLACVHGHLAEIRPPFLRDVKREAPEVFSHIEERRAGIIQKHFGRVLGAGRRAGMFRSDLPVKFVIEMLLGATRAIMNPEKITELGITPKAGYSAIISVIMQGIITEKGRSEL